MHSQRAVCLLFLYPSKNYRPLATPAWLWACGEDGTGRGAYQAGHCVRREPLSSFPCGLVTRNALDVAHTGRLDSCCFVLMLYVSSVGGIYHLIYHHQSWSRATIVFAMGFQHLSSVRHLLRRFKRLHFRSHAITLAMHYILFFFNKKIIFGPTQPPSVAKKVRQ